MKRSKKGIELLIGSSDVNSIFGCRELRKDRKIGTEDCSPLNITRISSTYLLHETICFFKNRMCRYKISL